MNLNLNKHISYLPLDNYYEASVVDFFKTWVLNGD